MSRDKGIERGTHQIEDKEEEWEEHIQRLMSCHSMLVEQTNLHWGGKVICHLFWKSHNNHIEVSDMFTFCYHMVSFYLDNTVFTSSQTTFGDDKVSISVQCDEGKLSPFDTSWSHLINSTPISISLNSFGDLNVLWWTLVIHGGQPPWHHKVVLYRKQCISPFLNVVKGDASPDIMRWAYLVLTEVPDCKESVGECVTENRRVVFCPQLDVFNTFIDVNLTTTQKCL